MILHYANIDGRQLGIGLTLNDQWWNWTTSKWETPFAPAAHVQSCVHSATIPELQHLDIPASLIPAGTDVVEFIVSATAATANAVLPVPENWVGPYAQRGTLTLRLG